MNQQKKKKKKEESKLEKNNYVRLEKGEINEGRGENRK